MRRTGILRVNQGVSRLDQTRLAIATAGNPFAAATNFLAELGLDRGNPIFAIGTDGVIGNVPVIFISDASPDNSVNAEIPAATASPPGLGRAVAASKRDLSSGRNRPAPRGSAKKPQAKRTSAKGSAEKANVKTARKGSKKSQ